LIAQRRRGAFVVEDIRSLKAINIARVTHCSERNPVGTYQRTYRGTRQGRSRTGESKESYKSYRENNGDGSARNISNGNSSLTADKLAWGLGWFSQLRGGIIMGIGMALTEETMFDDRTAQRHRLHRYS
jgi:hypothetical protein